MKNESVLGIQHVLNPSYHLRTKRSKVEDIVVYSDLPTRMDNMILIYVDFDDWHYTLVETVERITLSDAVGFIGGTIGIFTGFSIMSLIDLAAMFWKILKKHFKSK